VAPDGSNRDERGRPSLFYVKWAMHSGITERGELMAKWKDLKDWRVDDCDIDAHVHILPDGNIALLMTPLVARMVHEVVGHCSGDAKNPIRIALNAVWLAFEDTFDLEPDHYCLTDDPYEPNETEETFDPRTARAIAKRHG